jgi:hypothetical protein
MIMITIMRDRSTIRMRNAVLMRRGSLDMEQGVPSAPLPRSLRTDRSERQRTEVRL